MKEIWVTQREGQAIEHVLLPRAEYDAMCAAVDAAQAVGDSKEKGHIVAIMGGGDWYDASVEHLVVPSSMDLDAEHRAYREWYHQEYCAARRAGNKMAYLGFSEWLIKRGAQQTTDDEVLEFWEA